MSPPVLLLTADEEKAQLPEHRPAGAKLYRLKGDFLFHCHVHHHMMNGMVGLVRARQSLWLTDDMAHEISHRTGLPLDDGTNNCPAVDEHPCHGGGAGRWVEVAGAPAVLFMHSVLLPKTQRGPEPLLAHSDARVRAMAAENVGFHGDVSEARALITLLGDGDERVRTAAHEALIRLNGGADLGNDATAWEARFP